MVQRWRLFRRFESGRCPIGVCQTVAMNQIASPKPVSFSAELLQADGMKATGIVVPPAVLDQISSGRRPAVRVTLNGHAFRTTLGALAGNTMIPVSAEVRKAAGVAAGDALDITVVADTTPRDVVVPDDLAAALVAQPAAAAFFSKLPNGLQRYHVDLINGAKTDDTRRRRVDKAIELFLAGKQR